MKIEDILKEKFKAILKNDFERYANIDAVVIGWLHGLIYEILRNNEDENIKHNL